MGAYRNLTYYEISALEMQHCSCGDWSAVRVAEDFSPENISNCRFFGQITLGSEVTIRNIGSHIANYQIGDGAYIENVGRIECLQSSSFGNGVRVAAVNENGGRAVAIFDRLTAQQAYVMAMYRHRPGTIQRMERMVNEYAREVSSATGQIGPGAVITDCGVLRNVRVGAGATIEGAAMLENGSVNSTPQDPVYIGPGVNITDFITRGSCRITDGALLRRCFVGEGVEISALTATDTLFFANSSCGGGEMCSVLAGPYTVSHHKSTLLIAGMFSFFNAGSGSNQSNHLFKTGAVHQGIHMRGCKFGSDAYAMLPIKNGPFTVVIGRHKTHPDTENFPFSYLLEEDGSSFLMPGFNIGSYGTVRDIAKWPARDARKSSRRDIINFEECNPFLAERVMRAIEKCEALAAKEGVEVYNTERVKIKARILRRGLRLYRLLLDKYVGAMLSEFPDNTPLPDADTEARASEHWIDAAGMFLPAGRMSCILDEIDSQMLTTMEDIHNKFVAVSALYKGDAYSWAVRALAMLKGKEPAAEDIRAAITRGEEAEAKLRELTDEDCRKDFAGVAAVGYGIDSLSAEEAMTDFEAVRGPRP